MEGEPFFHVPRGNLHRFQNPPSQMSFAEPVTLGTGPGGMSEGSSPLKHIL